MEPRWVGLDHVTEANRWRACDAVVYCLFKGQVRRNQDEKITIMEVRVFQFCSRSLYEWLGVISMACNRIDPDQAD